jgi:hypothetical protein
LDLHLVFRSIQDLQTKVEIDEEHYHQLFYLILYNFSSLGSIAVEVVIFYKDLLEDHHQLTSLNIEKQEP